MKAHLGWVGVLNNRVQYSDLVYPLTVRDYTSFKFEYRLPTEAYYSEAISDIEEAIIALFYKVEVQKI